MKRFGLLLSATVLAGMLSAAQAQEESDHGRDRRNDREVAVGRDAVLEAGKQADSVVAVMGSVTSAGEVRNDIVAFLGDARITGPVGEDVSVVGGDVYLDSRVGGNVAVVLGNLTLGPQASIEGDVSVVGGTLQRDALASIGGDTALVAAGRSFSLGWMRPWIEECLLYGRPLALEPGLEWAWTLAIGFLVFYILLAVVFRDALERCVETLETRPGRTALASLATMVMTPVVFTLVLFTVVGILLLPFLGLALFCLGCFGKAAVLATLGRRFTGFLGQGVFARNILAVLLGAILVLALYLVPVVGFIVYKLLGILGLGVVMYTLALVVRANSEAKRAAAAAVSAGPAVPGGEAQAQQPQAPRPQTPPEAILDSTLPRAGFWMRMGALALDVVVVAGIALFLPFADGVSLLVLAAYGAVMWKLKGSTLGGIVFGIQVVRIDGRPVDWATAIVRALGCFLSLFIAGLGFLWIAFDNQKQGWHDKIAGTVVVRAPKGVSLL